MTTGPTMFSYLMLTLVEQTVVRPVCCSCKTLIDCMMTWYWWMLLAALHKQLRILSRYWRISAGCCCLLGWLLVVSNVWFAWQKDIHCYQSVSQWQDTDLARMQHKQLIGNHERSSAIIHLLALTHLCSCMEHWSWAMPLETRNCLEMTLCPVWWVLWSLS